MIRWHRDEYRDDQGVPIMMYRTDEKDWAAWSIDRMPVSNGSRTWWYEYQVVFHGDRIGPRHDRLRDAKTFVERNGRQP